MGCRACALWFSVAKGWLATTWQTVWPMGGVVSASLLIAWGTEVLSFFLSRGLAFAVLALLQVLPEFAVEAVITLKAAADPNNLQYVTANFTGANRMIVGMFVPLVFVMARWTARRRGEDLRSILLPEHSSVEVLSLFVATLYSFVIAFRGEVGLVDAVILIGIYTVYLTFMFRLPPESEEHEDLPLVPRMIRRQTPRSQKLIITGFFLFGGALLFESVEPFYNNTQALGSALGISAYFLLQWIAPFLSEFPEFITILYWGRTGRAEAGLTNAISSNIGQITLLVAMIPIVYAYGTWQHHASALFLHFDSKQQLEILLTSAQLLFAVACFSNLRLHRWEARTLFSLWILQVLDPVIRPWVQAHLPTTMPSLFPEHDYIREWITIVYLAMVPFVLFLPKHRFAAFRAFGVVWNTHIRRRRPASVDPVASPEP